MEVVSAGKDESIVAALPAPAVGSSLAKLPETNQDLDVRRLQAPLNPSPFNWCPVWNRTNGSSYTYNTARDEIRLNAEDLPGRYRIIHVGPTAVSSKVNCIDAGDVATLWQNAAVEVLAVVHRPELQRLRARIRSPPGWISLLNTGNNYRWKLVEARGGSWRLVEARGGSWRLVEARGGNNYRWAVKADVVITVSGAVNDPEVNGLYEHDSNEEDRGDEPYPRYRQVNGDHFLRLCYTPSPVWMITSVREGPPAHQIRCESRHWHERVSVSLASVPPTFPAAWAPGSVGMHGPMPWFTITFANAGELRRNPAARPHPMLGIVTLDYGYPPAAEDVNSSASLGYNVAHRLAPGLTLEAARSGELSEDLERSLLGAIQKLEQSGARAITSDCAFMQAFQHLAVQCGYRPAFMSPLVQWMAISCVNAKEDKFLILASDEELLRMQSAILKETAGLDLKEDRFIIRSCKDIPHLFDVTQATGIPTEAIEAAVVEIATSALQEHQGIRGVFLECVDVLPYTDAVKDATGLPVYDGVTGAELFTSLRSDYFRYEVSDWIAEALFEHGGREDRVQTSARQRLVGVIGLDYENEKISLEYYTRAARGYQALFKSIPDLTRYLTSLGKLTKACEKVLRETIAWMQDEVGVCAITGDCGFMMHYQVLIRDAVKVPVFMSPLMFCRMLLPLLPKEKRILIITASEPALQEQQKLLLSHCGFDLYERRYVVLGCEDIVGLKDLARKGMMDDEAAVQTSFMSRLSACLQEWPSVGVHIGAIVLECVQLLHCTELIRQVSGVPVLDAVNCADYFITARKQNERFGIKQWPYLWDGTIDEM